MQIEKKQCLKSGWGKGKEKLKYKCVIDGNRQNEDERGKFYKVYYKEEDRDKDEILRQKAI